MPNNIIANAIGPVSAKDVLLTAGSQAIDGAIGGGVVGVLGKFTGSFFAPGLVSGAGGFIAFAGVGALAALLKWLPEVLTDRYIENNAFLHEHPHLQSIIKASSELAYGFASVAASAALVGSPIGPTLACLMLLPVVVWALRAITEVVNALIEEKNSSPAPNHYLAPNGC
ncbi:MAG: hypothetical protein LEGION0403_FIIPPAGN_01265 [Legionella sp.]|uniref:hypothetical protein n=1 Tax=Legionella sp. TaxID=459 RepID=UPI003D0D1A46